MNTEDKNNMEEAVRVPTQQEKQSKAGNKLITFLKNNKAATILSLLLIIVFIWFSVKLRMNERNFKNEKTQLITQYESTIDSLQIVHLKFATEVFSWSVRSELLRNNTENLNQLLSVFVRESGADLVQIINHEDNIVLLSSDKKFEGIRYTDLLNFEIKNTVVKEEDGLVKIITPVMGFNNMIGILIVEIRNE
jgi:Ca2+/Na+ antiporter